MKITVKNFTLDIRYPPHADLGNPRISNLLSILFLKIPNLLDNPRPLGCSIFKNLRPSEYLILCMRGYGQFLE